MERWLVDKREAQHRLSTIARASMADFPSEGEDGSFRLDLEKAQEGMLLLTVRSLKCDELGRAVDMRKTRKSLRWPVFCRPAGRNLP